MSTENNTPASGQAPSPLSSAFQNAVGVRSLDNREQQLLLDRLEKNGTTLEHVNAITKAGEIEITEDPRSEIERKLDERDAPAPSPEGYLPQINLAPVFAASAPSAAIAEAEQHAAAFAHALELPKATAGEMIRHMVGEAVRVNALSPEAKAQHVARSQAILSKALGGPSKLQAAIADVQALVAKANPDFAKHIDMALTDPQTFLTLYHVAQRHAFRLSRRR